MKKKTILDELFNAQKLYRLILLVIDAFVMNVILNFVLFSPSALLDPYLCLFSQQNGSQILQTVLLFSLFKLPS